MDEDRRISELAQWVFLLYITVGFIGLFLSMNPGNEEIVLMKLIFVFLILVGFVNFLLMVTGKHKYLSKKRD